MLVLFADIRFDSAPCGLAGHNVKGVHSLAGRTDRSFVTRRVGDARKQCPAVACHAPMHTAIEATHACTLLPQDISFGIGVQAINHTGFLSREDHVTSTCRLHQYRRCTEIQIRSVFLWAVYIVAVFAARCVPCIAGNDLPNPAHTTRAQLKCDDRIAHVIGR